MSRVVPQRAGRGRPQRDALPHDPVARVEVGGPRAARPLQKRAARIERCRPVPKPGAPAPFTGLRGGSKVCNFRLPKVRNFRLPLTEARESDRSWLEGCVWAAARDAGLEWGRWQSAAAAEILRKQSDGWERAVVQAVGGRDGDAGGA